ncbi:MAG TPA: hypothetical protein VFF73_16340 [Planctomycetota bacterium]|nr:hypothetical protein [Planctomycetota bacterium]
MRPLLLVVLLATPALAQGYYERTPQELPAQMDPGAPLVVISPKPGSVHYGTNGWQNVQDATLDGPCMDGRYRAQIGPFPGKTELDLVLHNADGSWDNNGGNNYKVQLVTGAPVRRRPITIGAGPYIGTVGGQAYTEDVLDWQAEDCRGVDPSDDEVLLGDGEDESRDLIAFYSRRENGNLYLRVDLLDLGLGSEQRGSLVLGFLMEWGGQNGQAYLPEFAALKTAHPWNAALMVHDEQTATLYDASWNTVVNGSSSWWLGASYRSDLDTVELGVSEAALKKAGWDGSSTIRFQVYTMKNGDPRVCDAFQDSVGTGTLTNQIPETARGGTAKFSAIVHGNQTVLDLPSLNELIASTNVKTPAGNPTGYARALDAHETFGAPLNFHVSGTLAATIEWGNKGFNDRIRGFLQGKPWRGRGAFLGGVLSEHILPYFEGAQGPNVAGAALNDRLLASLYGVAKPTVFWTPERVIKGTTFDDIASAGYGFTVIDQVTHVQAWFGDAANTGHKLNKISGVTCFCVNDDADQWKFANTDGGLWIGVRKLLVGQALDSDQEKLTLVFDDWEACSGRSFTSFGTGNDNPDNYDRNVRWIMSHPWIQFVTLDDVASWGWGTVDRGDQPGLVVETYDWLRHASCGSYDDWMFGSSLNQDFSSLHPTIIGNQKTAKSLGCLGRSGTILNDAWQDVVSAPPSELRNLATAVYDCMAYETAWHDNTQTDYQDKSSSGGYQFPVTSYQNVSAWALAINGHAGDASLVAAAAKWAANPPAAGTTQAYTADLDQDGVPEVVLASNTAFCVFKTVGGRLVLAAARDPSTGDADLLVGSLLQGPASNLQKDGVELTTSAVTRPPACVDWWADNGGTNYVNQTYTASVSGNGCVLTSSDGKIKKTVTLAGGHLLVHYDTQVGNLYVRSGLAPTPLQLFTREASLSEQSNGSTSLTVKSQNGARTATVTVGAGQNANVNTAASFGSNGAYSVAFTRQVEVHGSGSFDLTFDFALTR